jgi:hypothetical protein
MKKALLLQGPAKNNFTFWKPVPLIRRRCENLGMWFYACISAPCQAGNSTPKIVNFFWVNPKPIHL